MVDAQQLGGILSVYLSAITEATDVNHRVRTPFDARPLTALNVDLRLSVLQQSLARTFALTWTASTGPAPEYTLEEKGPDRQARADARGAAQLAGQRRMRARWDAVRQMAFLPPERLKELAAAGETKASSLQDRRHAGIVKTLFQLPGPVLQQFWRTGRAEVPVSQLPSELRSLARDTLIGDRTDRPPDTVNRAVLQVGIGGTVDRPTVWTRISADRQGVDSNILYSEGWTRHPPASRRQAARASPTKPPQDPRLRRKVSLKDIEKRPRAAPGERPAGARPLAEYLKQLATQCPTLVMLAECDYRPKDDAWMRQQWWLAEDIIDAPLHEALDLLCADFEYEWKFAEGALLLRPRLWFLEPDQRSYRLPTFKRY
jgi:hypothetical protein